MPKIERSTPGSASVVSTPKAPAVTRSASSAEVAVTTPKGPATEYAGQAAPKKELVPRQAQLTRSADPSALWGEAPKAMALDAATFAKLPPAEQHKELQALRAERNELGQQILQRLEQLDVKWSRSRLVTRTEALREYQERTAHLEPAAKQELDGLLERSEGAQRKINELRARIDRLPKTPEQKAAMKELRDELARELRRLRAEQSAVVKEATQVVDAQGLKTDRLVVTEQVIDPSAPAPGSGQSLLEKLARFFELDAFLSSLGSHVEHETQAVERRGEQIKADVEARRERQVQEQRQQAQKLDQARTDDPAVVQVRAVAGRAFSAPAAGSLRPA